MTKYRFSEGAALVFGGSGGLGTGIVNLLAESGSDVAFTYYKNKESAENNLTNIGNQQSNIINIENNNDDLQPKLFGGLNNQSNLKEINLFQINEINIITSHQNQQ